MTKKFTMIYQKRIGNKMDLPNLVEIVAKEKNKEKRTMLQIEMKID